MLQESVYTKLVLNQTAASAQMDAVRKNKPGRGVVQTLVITEKQYARMEYILGSYDGDIVNTDERFVEL